MSDDHWQRVKEIFHAAAARAPGERTAFLEEACRGDAALRAEVEALLASDDRKSEFLELPTQTATLRELTGAPETADAAARDPLLGTQLGRYQLKRVIAAGGMGTVYEAVQEHPRRTVAVKVMKKGIASRSALRRFEYEAQILARLRHPNIAQIYDAGTHDDGTGAVPYFAMEYVPNAKSICDYARDKKLGTRERLQLFTQACDALHHGHQKGIIHRDLKPSNILSDSAGEVRIIDFGVARATDSDLAVTTLQTDVGQLIGTLQYMSPEQCEADPHDLDIRSDVYALGVVLYELLCDKLPYDVRALAVYEAMRLIREEPPTRLSTINRLLRGDVETIVLRALEKDRARRYQSAADLSRDIGHYLNNEPIEAKRDSAWYVIQKQLGRHKFPIAIAVGFVLVVTVGFGVSLGFWRHAEQQREIAESAHAEASIARNLEAEQRRLAEIERDRARAAEQDARWQTYVANVRAARAALLASDTASAHRALSEAPSEFRGWEWGYLNAESNESLATFGKRGVSRQYAALSEDGRSVAAVSHDGTVRLWDVTTGTELKSGRVHDDPVWSVTFSLDGRRLASGSLDGTVCVWDVTTGAPLHILKAHEDRSLPVALSPEGKQLASGSHHKQIRLWDTTTGAELSVLEADTVSALAFSPDGRRLASGAADGAVRVNDVTTGAELADLRGHDGRVSSVVFGPDGARLASGGEDGTVRIFDLLTGDELGVLRGHQGPVSSLAFSPDGARLASGSEDGTVRLWGPSHPQETRVELAVLRGHERPVLSVAFSADGTRLVSGSSDGTIRLWNAAIDERPIVMPGHEGLHLPTAFTSDCMRFASGSVDRSVHLRDATSGELLADMRGHENWVRSIAFSPDDTRLASGAEDGTVRVWNATNGTELNVVHAHDAMVSSVAFSPDGARLASGSRNGTIRLWDATTGAELITLQRLDGWFWSVAFSPDGRRLAYSPRDGTVRMWNSTTEEVTFLRGCEGGPLAFSPNGKLLVSGGGGFEPVLWDIPSGTEQSVLHGHTGAVWAAAFSPDGTRIATAAEDGTVRVWDVTAGDELIVLRGTDRGEIARSVAFSSDGCRLACASSEGKTVRIWNAMPYRIRYDQR